MSYIGVIFDVDGVIIDVSESYHYCIKETAEFFLGKELDINLVRKLKFESGINNDYLATLYIINLLGKKVDLEDIIRIFDEKYEKLKDKEKLILSHNFFKFLKNKGLKLGIVTGRPKKDLNYTFEKFDLFKYFDCIVDEDTIDNPSLRKPHPYALSFCINLMSISKAIYIGDSLADYRMWNEFKKVYNHFNLKVIYIHFGTHSDIEGVIKARDEKELSLVLEEVLHNL